jgi:hypothetical protein
VDRHSKWPVERPNVNKPEFAQAGAKQTCVQTDMLNEHSSFIPNREKIENKSLTKRMNMNRFNYHILEYMVR